jgi:signal transduction histidine kinase
MDPLTVVPIAPTRGAGPAGAPQPSPAVAPRAVAPARNARRALSGRVARDLALLNAQVRELSRALAHAHEDERTRLARDLHDELGAQLISARLAAARLETWLPADAPPACAQALGTLCAALEGVCSASRRLINERHAPQIDSGLVPALSQWTTQFSARTQLHTSLVCAADARLTQLAPDATHALYRITQEALNNVAKHANASSVMLRIVSTAETLTLEISDDGRGMTAAARAKHGHFGLAGMRARCEAFGGTLQVASPADRGADLKAPATRARRGVTVTACFAWDALIAAASNARSNRQLSRVG